MSTEVAEKIDVSVELIEAVSLLEAMGVPNVAEWKPKRVETKLNNLLGLISEAKPPNSRIHRALVKSIQDCLESGGKVTVGENAPAEKPKPARGEKSGKNGDHKPTRRKLVGEGKLADPPDMKAEVETTEEPESAKPVKEPKAKKESARVKVLGKYAAGPFTRWLGRNNVSLDDAKKIVIDGEGCLISEPSLKWELKERREKAPPADVSPADRRKIASKYGVNIGNK